MPRIDSQRHSFHLLLLCLALGFLAACSKREPVVGVKPAPPISGKPERIVAALTPMVTLPAAADQLAKVVGVPVDQVRVRIQPQSCVTCNLEENAKATSLAGLSVDEAAQRLKATDTLWLFVQKFTCIYRFDGETFTPQGCQSTPV